MAKTLLYQQIAESIRQEILYGPLRPDDELPTIRQMSEKWSCSPGTVLRAYQELARQGLVTGRPGAGTRVARGVSDESRSPLRKATLIQQAEVFLLQALGSGFTPDEIDQAVHVALDRWRASIKRGERRKGHILRFVGSHDPAISLLAARLREEKRELELHISFVGSMGGLMALARREADLAGSHLWDDTTNTYNRVFIQHLMPGRRIALVKLADRHLGLLVAPGNPLGITRLEDLGRSDLRFINRQEGAGTRVWLDVQLRQLRLDCAQIHGYETEALTHSEVASAIVGGRADAGLGIESVALAYGLGFVPLTKERYDLVIPAENWEAEAIQTLISLFLPVQGIKEAIHRLGGYDTSETGLVEWVS